MCGIAGIFEYANNASPDRQLLARMTGALAHRGPDAEDFYYDGPVAFGHRRLSIVDLSPTGAQPMQTTDGRFCINYNGELYGHTRFRSRLESRGVRFRGTSDTETLLNLVAHEGVDALDDASGIFAFALWDKREEALTLVRDPLGVKQLYFHDDGKRVIFASEIKALLLDASIRREINPEALNDYLHFHTPLFERTFFKTIEQVEAGQSLVFTTSGRRQKRYWSLRGFRRDGGSINEQIEELTELLRKVVSEQLMSDVPVGAFFSGGVDSSAVAAFAQKAGRRLTCFGVHFSNEGVIDERPYQEAAAKSLGLDLELITLAHGAFSSEMKRLQFQQDQPVIGAALFPMDAVSRLASGKVKVCLGGQAADEIFGGYARYALAQPMQVARNVVFGRQSTTTADGGTARVKDNLFKQLADRENVKRLVRNLPHLPNGERLYFEHFAKVDSSTWKSLMPAAFDRGRAWTTYTEALNRVPAHDAADRIMWWDAQTYLGGLFQQDDRMSMAHSLESRVPLADPRLVRFAYGLPFSVKMRAGATKWILRQAVADVIPENVLNRRKAGFDTPAEMWMRTSENDFVRDTLTSAAARSRPWWDGAAVARIVESTDHPFWFDVVWKLLCIELWAEVFLDGGQPDA